MNRHLLVAIIICIFTTGCGAREAFVTLDPLASCDEIVHPSLLSVPFEELGQGQGQPEEWILAEFPTVTVKFEPYEVSDPGNFGWFYWSEGERGFSLHVLPQTSYLIQFQHARRYPTLGHILRCYGQPQYYMLEDNARISVEAIGVWFEFWYFEKGLRFQDLSWGLDEARRFDANTPITGDTIYITPLGVIEEKLRTSDFYKERQEWIHEWPDNFTEFVLE